MKQLFFLSNCTIWAFALKVNFYGLMLEVADNPKTRLNHPDHLTPTRNMQIIAPNTINKFSYDSANLTGRQNTVHHLICGFFISQKSVHKSGFVHTSGESSLIESVGDFIHTMFSSIGSNV